MGICALMNARGLMELIIINIGLQKGIIGPTLFSIMVLMAIVTTVMAGPLFEVVYGRKAREAGELGALGAEGVTPVPRSEEHTSELQSLMRISYAAFCLKKKKTKKELTNIRQ